MNDLAPRFKIGDTVWVAYVETKSGYHDCPDCNGTKVWPITSPAGESMTMPCPRCQGNVDSSLSLRYTRYTVYSKKLTIGSVRTDTADEKRPISYMCRETGIGSGSVYYEGLIWATEDEALAACEVERSARQNENDAKPEVVRSYDRMSKPYLGGMRSAMYDEIRLDVMKKLRAEWDDEYVMGEHTKGPWLMTESISADGVYSFDIYGQGDGVYRDTVSICSGYGGLSDGFAKHSEGPKNARILMASLKLLTACQRALDALESDETVDADELREAVALTQTE